MPRIQSDGVGIAYEILNKKSQETPVFVIAGLNGMRQSCMKQAIPFSQYRPTIIHDHRGTGESDKPLGVYSIENMAKDVISLMDELGIEKAHIVGTSTGGAIAQVLCLDYDERIQSSAICCSWLRCDHFFRRQFETRKWILKEMGPVALMHATSISLNDPKWLTEHFDELVEKEKGQLERKSPVDVYIERIDALLAFDESKRLGQIKTPVKVIGSKNDGVCPAYYSEEIAKLIPGATLSLYEDGGHFFYMVYADRFNKEILDFMSEHD